MTATLLSPDSQRALLEWARAALAAHFGGQALHPQQHDDELQHPAAVFVTLRRRSDHELRGCIGYMDREDSLAAVVAEAAVAAATRDGRFDDVTAAELTELRIEISVLGPVSAIDSDEVEVGRHGLIVQFGGRRGLLLPQVPVDRGWDREAFLGWTCRKAGLPPDTWKKPDCELLGFTAQVFGEGEAPFEGCATSGESPAPVRA